MKSRKLSHNGTWFSSPNIINIDKNRPSDERCMTCFKTINTISFETNGSNKKPHTKHEEKKLVL